MPEAHPPISSGFSIGQNANAFTGFIPAAVAGYEEPQPSKRNRRGRPRANEGIVSIDDDDEIQVVGNEGSCYS